MLRIKPLLLGGLAAAGAAALTLALSSCSLMPSDCQPHSVLYLLPDTSGSTAPERGPGGEYQQDMMSALRTAAGECSDVFSAPADANSIGGGTGWVINDQTFRTTIGANANLSAAAREADAARLSPTVTRLLHLGDPDGTDLLGALQAVVDTVASLRDTGQLKSDETVKIALLTDGMLNLPLPGENMYRARLSTPAEREAYVARLAASGELPDLDGAQVYLSGLGEGTPPPWPDNVISTWRLLVAAMHGDLQTWSAPLVYN